MTIQEFLRNYEIRLGDLDTDNGEEVVRDSSGVVVNNQTNQDLYRDFGIDVIIEAAGDFALEHVEDEQGNLFADSPVKPLAELYYQTLPDTFGPQTAEILIANSQRVDECEDLVSDDAYEGGLSDDDFSELTECYMNRVFQAIAVAGLTRTFPVYESPGGTIIPIFNVVPTNRPSGFSVVLVSIILPTSSSGIFVDLDFTVPPPFTKVNRFRWKKSNPPEEIEDVFSPKSTVSSEGNIDFVFNNETLDGSAGSVFFTGDLNFSGGSFSDFDINVQFSVGNQSVDTDVTGVLGENAYITTEASEIELFDFSAGNFTLTAVESAEFGFLTIDNGFDQITISGPYSESDPDDFISDLESRIQIPDYVELTNDNGTVKANGKVAHISFTSPTASDSSTADPMTALFNLPVFVFDGTPTISNPDIDNIRSIEVVSDAPFFEDQEWNFISQTVAPISSDLQEIDISAAAFDPSFDINDAEPDIVDKSINSEYDGFGATVRNYQTGARENASESIMADFFTFHKNYVEDNFLVVHIGISNSGTGIVSAPEQLTVTLD